MHLNREFGLVLEHQRSLLTDIHDTINRKSKIKITHTYPFNSSCFKPYIGNNQYVNEFRSNGNTIKRKLIIRKLRDESLFIVKDSTEKFQFTIDPLLNFEYGKDLADTSGRKLFKNTRGILIRGDIGTKFSFESSFYENQATFVKYIQDFNDTFLVVPGQGRWKRFKKDGYDFAMASGYISYSPTHHFNFQAGTGKHFIGDGYRSLLLSDNAFNYPYARITSSFGKFQYTNLFASFMNLTDGGVKTPFGTEKLFQKKAGSFQFLSWNVCKRIQLGFFQGMMWKSSDSMNRINLNASYFNPLIFANAIQYGLSHENNILLGATLKIKITNLFSLYGQYMLDDASEDFIKNSLHNKQGFQIGAKYFDVFRLKNLHLQLEYNQVRPYCYASEKNSQSYTHYNQALAHPLGANFKEAVAFLNYRVGYFFTEVKFNYTLIGKDSIGKSFGNNIFSSDNAAYYGSNSTLNEMGQGVKTILRFIDAHISYLVNPSTNFNIVIGVSNRSGTYAVQHSQTNYIYFGIRTSLNNIYYDF